MTSSQTQGPPAGGARPRTSGVSEMIRLLSLALRQARLILASALLAGSLALVYVVTRPRAYTATGSFLLQPPRLAGGVASGIAAQLGLSLPTSDPGQSPAFYEEMIRSRALRTALADSAFTYRNAEGSAVTSSLADAYHIRDQLPALRREATLERLDRSIVVRTSPKSGVVTFSVESPEAELASHVAEAVLGELSNFNLQRRQSQAEAERRFTEKRLAEVATDLREAENSLEAFLGRNRSTSNSPQLKFAEDRLGREVELRRALYAAMAQSYEQAKIEEVRDTPQMTVVGRPEVPPLPDPRGLIGKAMLSAILGGFLGLLFGYTRERIREATRRGGDEIVEFESLRAAVGRRFARFASGAKHQRE